jgi:hypothetical protein
MGLADNTVGLDAGKRTLLSNSHRKTNCSLGPLFSIEDWVVLSGGAFALLGSACLVK